MGKQTTRRRHTTRTREPHRDEEYECPECSAVVGSDWAECPNCGVGFLPPDEDGDYDEVDPFEEAAQFIEGLGRVAEAAIHVATVVSPVLPKHPLSQEIRERAEPKTIDAEYSVVSDGKPEPRPATEASDVPIPIMLAMEGAAKLFEIPVDSGEAVIRQRFGELSGKEKNSAQEQKKLNMAYELLMQDAIRRDVAKHQPK